MLEFGWTVLPFYWLIATCLNALSTRKTHRRNYILKEKIIASLTLEKRDSQNLGLPNSKIVIHMERSKRCQTNPPRDVTLRCEGVRAYFCNLNLNWMLIFKACFGFQKKNTNSLTPSQLFAVYRESESNIFRISWFFMKNNVKEIPSYPQIHVFTFFPTFFQAEIKHVYTK